MMSLEALSWVVIVLAFIGANLPFLSNRMFVFSPVCFKTEPKKFTGYYVIRAVLFYGVFATALFFLSDPSLSLSIKVGVTVVVFLLFGLAGFTYRPYIRTKNIAIHLAEMACFMCLVAAIGFFIEANYSNSFEQHWQFYAIGISIFLIMGFPGFVWRYLMHHRHKAV